MKTIFFLSTLFFSACSSQPPAPRAVEYVPVMASTPLVRTDVLRNRAAAPAGVQGFDAQLTRYDYPYPVHTFDFRSQSLPLQMAYMDVQGRSPNGHTVVLFHGANFTAATWGQTITALAEHGYRVIAPDQVGFGKSSKPVRYQFSFAALASNTARLLDSLRIDKVSVIGHSMGGMLAVRWALQNPTRTERLILVNPIGLEDWQLSVPYQPIEQAYQRELAATRASLKAYMQSNYTGGAWSAIYDEPLDVLAGWQGGPDRQRVAWDRALVSDMIFTQPVVQEFPSLRVPTLLLIGQRDRTAIGKERAPAVVASRLGDYPNLGRLAQKRIPHAKLVELPLAGHLPQFDSFDAYIREVGDFLEANYLQK